MQPMVIIMGKYFLYFVRKLLGIIMRLHLLRWHIIFNLVNNRHAVRYFRASKLLI